MYQAPYLPIASKTRTDRENIPGDCSAANVVGDCRSPPAHGSMQRAPGIRVTKGHTSANVFYLLYYLKPSWGPAEIRNTADRLDLI